MSSINDATTFGRARLSFANESEVDEFASTLDKFERGEITADQWRAFRLVRGTYGQRQTDDASMLRIKIPQGILTGEQIHAIADVAATYSRGFGHITTRQNIQLHFIRLHDVEPAMRQLAAAGLTTREACGNSVRNITACPYSGVAADEAFDVTPYSEALTRYFLRHPLSSALPRKFKIAFEGCPEDHAYTGIHDIGWRALVQDDDDGRPVRGFRVTRRRRHGDHVPIGLRALRLPAGVRDAERVGSDRPRVPPAGRLSAQGAQPDEVPGQVAWLGGLPHRVREGADRLPGRGRRDAAVRSGAAAGRAGARLATACGRRCADRRAARRRAHERARAFTRS